MLLSELRALTLAQLRDEVLARMARRRRIGPFDWGPDSWDRRVAMARAFRVMCRANGRRISMRDALCG
jgi:hypothetical protein